MKQIKHTLFTLALAALITSCTKEVGIDTPGPGVAADEITITVRIPGQQTPSTRSMDGAAENAVKTIDVLVFDYATGGGTTTETFYEHVKGEVKGVEAPGTAGDPYTATFSVKLEARSNVRLVLLANMTGSGDTAFDFTQFTEGDSKHDVLSALIVTNTEKWAADGTSPNRYRAIPMYGETAANINISSLSKITGVELRRMLARIDVINAADADFKLKYIGLYRPQQSGFMAPNWNLTGNQQGQIVKPYNTTPNVPGYDSRPGAATQNSGLMQYASYPGNETSRIVNYAGEIYTFESVAADKYTTGKDWDANSTALILGGTLGSSQTVTYYRVDFTFPNTDPAVNPDYMPLLRNYKYVVTISAVTGKGFATPELAAQNKGITNNFKTTIHSYDEGDLTDFVYDGNYYLGLENSESIIRFMKDSELEVLCSTNDEHGWQIDTEIYPTGIQYYQGSNWLSATKDGTETDGKANLKMKILLENANTYTRTAIVYLKAGSLRHQLNVTQTGGVLTFEAQGGLINLNFTYNGGTQDFTVKSSLKEYFPNGVIEESPVPWIAEFSEDWGTTWGSAPPSWLDMPVAGGDADVSTTFGITAALRPLTTDNVEDIALRDAPVRGSESEPYDLSTKGTTASNMNTANSYIVNAGGYYKLPLVYGNAIKNGADNPSSYSSNAAAASNTFLTAFVRHDNKPITGPYLYAQTTPTDVVPDHAMLLWMYAPEIITNVRLTDNDRYLAFDVPQENIVQGNAIVAVRNSANQILWSWHIWITPLVNMDNPATDKTINNEGNEYLFLQYNLGYCTPQLLQYGTETRRSKVRITQQILSGKYGSFDVVQANGTLNFSLTDNTPRWQWGRKDPMGHPGSRTYFGEMKPISATWANQELSAGIIRPDAGINITTNGTGVNWNKYHHTNLWNADNTLTVMNSNPVVKTVYDPSPAGFKVPPPDAWTGFTTTGENSSTQSQFNVSGAYSEGWNFFLEPNFTGGTAYYPFVNNGVYATSGPQYTDTYLFYFSNNTLYPKSRGHKTNVGNVRCIKDE